MLPVSTLLSLLVIIYSRRTSAQLQPTTPGPDETYTAGLNCTIAWEPDSSGSWTNVTIDLMSGSNNNMSLVTNVITGLDGTDASLTPFSWTCPEVNPFSTIYFYQFTNGEDISTRAWTTRFTITSPANETEPPENPEQPDGENVPWGIGYIKSPSKSESTSISSTNSTNSLSDSETEGSAGSSNAKKPHGHKSDSDSANSDSPSDPDDYNDGKWDEKGERKNNADDDETDDSSEEKSSTKTHPANVSGAKSSAARATSVAHSGTHDSFSSSPNDSDTNGYDESDDPDDSDDPHSRSGSGSGSRSQQESNTNADSDSDSDWYSDSGSQAQSQSSFSSHDRGDGECRCGVVTNAGLSVSGAKSLMDASLSGVVSSVAPSLFIALVVMYM